MLNPKAYKFGHVSDPNIIGFSYALGPSAWGSDKISDPNLLGLSTH